MASSRSNYAGKTINDAIHGDIRLKDREIRIIDTFSFQRLRRLKQLAMAQLVYPAATHTRFAHSIGALGVMERILEAAKKNGPKFNKEQKENLRLAALLHDIGHYPYSHLMERVDKVKLSEEQKEFDAKKSEYPEHDEIGKLIVTRQKDLVDAIGSEERAQIVANFLGRGSSREDQQINKLIHSSVDIDRMDYLLRDSHGTGVPYGRIDINYLLNKLKISPEGVIGFEEKALPAVEHFLLGRFYMHCTVYYHKTIYGFEEMCRQLLRRLRDRDGENYGIPNDGQKIKELVTSKGLNTFTDAFVDDIIQKAVDDKDSADSAIVRILAKAIQNRRPPVLLKEVPICEERGRQHHAGKAFNEKCNYELKQLSDKFGIPLEQFLLCQTPPLTVIKYPEQCPIEQTNNIPPEERRQKVEEEEEADIKIFAANSNEPESLYKIDHSLVAKYAKYYYQVFRFYVVYEGEDKNKVVNQLKLEINKWS
jgi:HD superfamily phosphohydrolase